MNKIIFHELSITKIFFILLFKKLFIKKIISVWYDYEKSDIEILKLKIKIILKNL